MSGVCWGRRNSPIHRRIQAAPSESLGKIKSSWKQTMLAWWMAFGCCHVVAAGTVFLESCSMSLLKNQCLGQSLEEPQGELRIPPCLYAWDFRVSQWWAEIPSWERWSGGLKRLRGKKIVLLCFEAMHVLFEALKFTAWGEERGWTQDWSFLYSEEDKPVPWGL